MFFDCDNFQGLMMYLKSLR